MHHELLYRARLWLFPQVLTLMTTSFPLVLSVARCTWRRKTHMLIEEPKCRSCRHLEMPCSCASLQVQSPLAGPRNNQTRPQYTVLFVRLDPCIHLVQMVFTTYLGNGRSSHRHLVNGREHTVERRAQPLLNDASGGWKIQKS